MKNIILAFMLAFAVMGCKADIGEACSTSGSVDECTDGAICSSGTCRKTCTADSDCASTEACNGTSGSNVKSCQPK